MVANFVLGLQTPSTYRQGGTPTVFTSPAAFLDDHFERPNA